MKETNLRILVVFLILSGLLKFNFTVSGQSKSQPNIVLILVDDLGWSDLGYMGSKNYDTPNVDRLSTQGMSFSDFYSGGPVCSPTRASILTGKYTARTGVTTYLITPDQDPDYISHHLALSEYTVGEAFRDQGYVTGYFGKWHLGYQAEYWASNQGFMTSLGGATSRNAWKMLYPERQPPVDQLETLYFSPHFQTHMEDGPKGEYLTDRLTDETMDFIQDNANNGKPFFAFLSFHAVHTPLEAKAETIEYYHNKFLNEGLLGHDTMKNGSRKYQNLPKYAAMVKHMDENVGRLLDKIDELGIGKNTIVIFTSDNGGKHSVTSNAPLRGAKHNLYEGGIRIPLIVRWPDRIEAGSECSEPWISNDFYPTLLDLAGLPLLPNQHKDGKSFKNILLGIGTAVERGALFWHYPHGVFQAAVRDGKYKLLYHYKTGEAELYDLSEDIGENTDIREKEVNRVQRMKEMLSNWLEATHARFPEKGVIMP